MTEPERDGAPPRARRRLEARVTGRVQGVGYRAFVLDQAARLGLDGWVSNEPDGSVRVVAEGDEAALGALSSLLRRGPMAARVTDIEVRWGPAAGVRGFRVRAGGHPGD